MNIEFLISVGYCSICLFCVIKQVRADEEKGLIREEKDSAAVFYENDLQRKLNTADTFTGNLRQDTFIFLVGNNNYNPAAGLNRLQNCTDDVRLLENIFIYCCNIKKGNIFSCLDLTAAEFKSILKILPVI